jgi:hypothetical protein
MSKRITTAVCVVLITLWWSLAGGSGCYYDDDYYDDDDGDCDLKIQTDLLPPAIVGIEYRFNLDSKCGGDDWFISEGNLPPGIALQSDGDLLGTPVAEGSYIFTVGLIEYDYYDYDEAYKGFQLVVTRLSDQQAMPTPSPTAGP